MAVTAIPTDPSLRSQLTYGEAGFPFACYLDRFTQEERQSIRWHWHDEFEFSFAMQGTVICRIGSSRVVLNPGDGIFINSGVIHRFDGCAGGVLANYIFLPSFIAEKASVIYAKYVQPVSLSDLAYHPLPRNRPQNAPVSALLREALEVVEGAAFGRELRIRDLIARLWLCFARDIFHTLEPRPVPRNNITQLRLHQMLTHIHTHYHTHLTLADIALSANISKSEALRCFHIGLETTPVKYLNEYRLDRAAEALLSSPAGVAWVADACGFESTGYFCRVFKSRYGVSPNEFRRARLPAGRRP